jgi:quercetin dioxygenase-like cupin family protein
MTSAHQGMYSQTSVLPVERTLKVQFRRTGFAIAAIVATQLIAGCATAASPSGHLMQTLEEVQWGDAPPMLPAGAKIAVLSGNPGADGLFTVRLKFPAHYAIPAHSHPKDEFVTVLKGTVFMGMADKLDPKAGKALPAGSFAITPAGTNHYAYTEDETIILLHGLGPVDFKYVNPSDDPRTKH